MVRRLALALGCLSLLGLAACKGDCRELAERVCDCEADTLQRDLCNRDAQRAEGVADPDNAEEERCGRLLDTCRDSATLGPICQRLNTAEGKQACGLAEPLPPPASTP